MLYHMFNIPFKRMFITRTEVAPFPEPATSVHLDIESGPLGGWFFKGLLVVFGQGMRGPKCVNMGYIVYPQIVLLD